MPFANFRRRNDGTTTGPQPEEGHVPVSSATSSAPSPTVTPRKSFASLIDSCKRGRNSNVSLLRDMPDTLEEALYPQYDATNPDHNPQRAGSPSRVESSPRILRTPSPHPVKGAGSRLSRLHLRNLSRSRSQSSLKDEHSPKTLLESLADAIRAPTSLFYKDSRQPSQPNDAAPALSTTNASAAETKPSSISPKKSVRFRPQTSFIEPEPRSSPIDIPKSTPSLPPMQLASTPLANCLMGDLQRPILTARPIEPNVMRSSIDFRHAQSAAQERVGSKCTETDVVHSDQTPKPPSPPETTLPMKDWAVYSAYYENEETRLDSLPGTERTTQSETSPSVILAHVASGEVTLTLKAQARLSSEVAAAPSKSSSAPSEDDSEDVSPLISGLEEMVSDGLEPAKTISNGKTLQCSLGSAPDVAFSTKTDFESSALATESVSICKAIQSSVRAGNDSYKTMDKICSDLNNNHLSPGSSAKHEWIDRPTHEDIRQQFKSSSAGKLFRENDHIYLVDEPDKLASRLAPRQYSSSDESIASRNSSLVGVDDLSLKSLGKFSDGPRSPTIDGRFLTDRHLSPQDFMFEISEVPKPRWTAELTLRTAVPPSINLPSRATYADTQSSLSAPVITTGALNLPPEGFTVEVEPISTDESQRKQPVTLVGVSPSPNERLPVPSYSNMTPTHIDVGNYCDQYLWSPFLEKTFPCAAVAAIGVAEPAFRQLLGVQGCFHAFWELCGLPESTKPCKDTRGLRRSEIDSLLYDVQRADHFSEPSREALLQTFSARLSPTSLAEYAVGTHSVSAVFEGDVDDTRPPTCDEHELFNSALDDDPLGGPWADVSTNFDHEMGFTEGLPDTLDVDNIPEACDEVAGESVSIPPLTEREKLEKTSTIIRNSRARVEIAPISSTNRGSTSSDGQLVVDEQTGHKELTTEDSAVSFACRRQTMESQFSLSDSRRRSVWSDKSHGTTSTSASSTMEALEEDEGFCRGII